MKIDFAYISAERETVQYLLSQLIIAAAPVRFKVKATERGGRDHLYLEVSETCPVKPSALTTT